MSDTQLPLVSIIVVNYRTPDLVLRITSALQNPLFEIVVVDNSPTIELERLLKTSAMTTYIKNTDNLGFAGGVNVGLEVAKGEWIYLLNSDAHTTPEDIHALLLAAKEHHASVVAPQLIKDDGSIERNVGYFSHSFDHIFDWLFARPRLIDPNHLISPIIVDLATGGALLVHKSVFEKIGIFDAKRFFMYFEDIDFSRRLSSNGIHILYVPTVQVRHRGGGSSDQDPLTKMQNYRTSLYAYLLKHRGPLIALLNTKIKIFD